jgi:hypothetical protein
MSNQQASSANHLMKKVSSMIWNLCLCNAKGNETLYVVLGDIL